VLPHRAVAKLDLRLVPNMTFDGRSRSSRRTCKARASATSRSTRPAATTRPRPPADASIIAAEVAVYKRAGLDPLLTPRNAGSYPGYVFTGAPLKLPAAHFGLGHGSGAHAPDEYFVIESTEPAGARVGRRRRSYVDFLYELAK
jgi:acetylornithine deacetylase/succinyl-diaminopimelate desuccinylase-like protein